MSQSTTVVAIPALRATRKADVGGAAGAGANKRSSGSCSQLSPIRKHQQQRQALMSGSSKPLAAGGPNDLPDGSTARTDVLTAQKIHNPAMTAVTLPFRARPLRDVSGETNGMHGGHVGIYGYLADPMERPPPCDCWSNLACTPLAASPSRGCASITARDDHSPRALRIRSASSRNRLLSQGFASARPPASPTKPVAAGLKLRCSEVKCAVRRRSIAPLEPPLIQQRQPRLLQNSAIRTSSGATPGHQLHHRHQAPATPAGVRPC